MTDSDLLDGCRTVQCQFIFWFVCYFDLAARCVAQLVALLFHPFSEISAPFGSE